MNTFIFPSWATWVTVCMAGLVVIASVLGIIDPSVYKQETYNWATQAFGQDVGNLLAVLVLLAGWYAAKKGSSTGLFVWLGAIFYFLYAYIIYAVGVHFNYLFLAYVAILGLAVYATAGILYKNRTLSIAYPAVRPRKVAGTTLIAIGVLFLLLWLSELIPALLNASVPKSLLETALWTNPVHVIDLAVVLPGMIIVGVLARRGRDIGLFFTMPLLVFSVLMGVSIVTTMAIMAARGFENTLPPLIMVAVVVLVSIIAGVIYVRSIAQAKAAVGQ